jgi:ArsR family transcriptional regulator, arsenate/arsenite/antimonite-responsive transcriptional repressor / arsenate reductase (thioredoxin)
MSARHNALPPLLDLAGHPLRWGILCELARSDARVRDLTAVLGEQQSLVSYHLGRLRSSGLVATRRSSFDGRDAYYRVDLARCQRLFAQAGGELHPGLRLVAPTTPLPADRSRVLFLCTGNSGRSQMAEGILRRLSPQRAEAFSAGSRPKPVHPEAIRTLGERGLDIAAAKSKHLSVYATDRFDHVVTLCDRVREVCPDFPGSPERAHWSVPDPASDPRPSAAFRRVADELSERIGFFLHVLAVHPTSLEGHR